MLSPETTIPGVDGQVVLAAGEMTPEQKAAPEWLWHEDHRNITSYECSLHDPSQAPYIRADIVLAMLVKPDLGRIGKLADDLRFHARMVVKNMHMTPGGDAFDYQGSTNDVKDLINAVNDLEHFQAGWK